MKRIIVLAPTYRDYVRLLRGWLVEPESPLFVWASDSQRYRIYGIEAYGVINAGCTDGLYELAQTRVR